MEEINDIVFLGVQGYRYSNEQRDCCLTLYIQFNFGVSGMEIVIICSLYQKYWRIGADCRPKNWVLFQRYLLLLVRHDAAVSLNHKNGRAWMHNFFVRAFAKAYYSMLGLGDVKNVVLKVTVYLIYVIFFQKPPRFLFVKWIKLAQTGKLSFERHQLLQVSDFCKRILSMLRTMWISSFNNSNAFNQPGLKVSLQLIRYEVLFGQLDHQKDLRWYFHESKAFKLHTTACLFIWGVCSTWVVFSHWLSALQKKWVCLNDFLRQALSRLRRTWYFCLNFSDGMSTCEKIKCLYN